MRASGYPWLLPALVRCEHLRKRMALRTQTEDAAGDAEERIQQEAAVRLRGARRMPQYQACVHAEPLAATAAVAWQ